jgi:hypothetical protein
LGRVPLVSVTRGCRCFGQPTGSRSPKLRIHRWSLSHHARRCLRCAIMCFHRVEMWPECCSLLLHPAGLSRIASFAEPGDFAAVATSGIGTATAASLSITSGAATLGLSTIQVSLFWGWPHWFVTRVACPLPVSVSRMVELLVSRLVSTSRVRPPCWLSRIICHLDRR